jgi:type IV secretory pathway VirB3-like protein
MYIYIYICMYIYIYIYIYLYIYLRILDQSRRKFSSFFFEQLDSIKNKKTTRKIWKVAAEISLKMSHT